MQTIVIANPRAGNHRVGKLWADYQRHIVNIFAPSQIHLTTAPGEATLLARKAIRDGAERIVAVGGDGTVNEVVNGFFEHDQPIGANVSLAICSVGTGGDFARSIGLSGVPLADAYRDAREQRIDVGKASYINRQGKHETRYFLNIASLGSSGLVAEKVNTTSKSLGAKISFYVGTLRGLLAYKNQRVHLRIDDQQEKEMVVNTIAIANGRYFGGSMMIAPNALLDDGAFDVVVVGDVGVLTFLLQAPRLYRGAHLNLPFISSFRGQTFTATPLGIDPVLLELDGEQVGRLPVHYQILPQALRLYAPLFGTGINAPQHNQSNIVVN